MFTYNGIDENFKFLILELEKQLEETKKALDNPGKISYEKIAGREDYIDNLKSIITRKSYNYLYAAGKDDKQNLNKVMFFNAIVSNLEKLGDYLEHIVQQIKYFTDIKYFHNFKYNDYFRRLSFALSGIIDSFFYSDTDLALEICKVESDLDSYYKRDFDIINDELKHNKKNTGDIITTLFILRYLERAGDVILNIGEGIISSVSGTKIKINQFIAMKESFESEDEEFEIQNVAAETKSGCRIDILRKRRQNKPYEVIFKEGRKKKIIEEKIKADEWQSIYPGITPKVIDYHYSGDNASILMEFIHGKNFQEILLGNNSEVLQNVLDKFFYTLESVWNTTKNDNQVKVNFIHQLKSRLGDVFKLHPSFKSKRKTIGNKSDKSFLDLIEELKELESAINVPFTVYNHGDMNNDNLIYDETEDKLYFIDLHRSEYADYVQDVSVFIISNFRMPVFNEELRKRSNKVSLKFLYFARNFAVSHNDDLFEVRLALGLIRSFITSTRFSLKKDFAKEMYLRAIFLTKELLVYKENLDEFKVKEDIIIY